MGPARGPSSVARWTPTPTWPPWPDQRRSGVVAPANSGRRRPGTARTPTDGRSPSSRQPVRDACHLAASRSDPRHGQCGDRDETAMAMPSSRSHHRRGGRLRPRASHHPSLPPFRLLGTSDDAARLVDGPLISNQTLERLTCDARLQLAIEEPGKGTVGVGRTTRSIPLARSNSLGEGWRCRLLPSGPRPLGPDPSSVTGRRGPTDADNPVILCGFHRRRAY